jgi:D-alanyl-D-alanine dipeptidase
VLFFITACTSKKEIDWTDNGDQFVDLKEIIPSVQLDIRYYTKNNFIGSRIDGYDAPKCLLTRDAALALKNVQKELASNRQSLKIFDCYRPQRAVDHFVRWAKDLNDQKMKAEYYPSIDKKNLFRDGYIAEQSGHSRGSTVDLTIIDLNSNRELDMGTHFDYFDPLSHTVSSNIGKIQHGNKMALKTVMERNGFRNLKEEWWHFTLNNEAFTNQYFDFKIE